MDRVETSLHKGTTLERFVVQIITRLNQENIKYVVLRNYEGLPGIVGNDIDLLIAPDQINYFRKIVQTADATGWLLIRTTHRHGFLSLVFGHINEYNKIELLKWDCWHPITWKGIPWVDCEKILSTRRSYKNFYIPSAGAETVLLCLKDAIQIGAIRSKYFERISELESESNGEIDTVLNTYWPVETIQWLKLAIQQKNWGQIENHIPQLRKELLQQSIRRDFISTIRNFLHFLIGHIQDRFYKKNGNFICFVGPDGSGKSTISGIIADSLSPMYSKTQYYHGHFAILPELSKLWSRSEVSQGNEIESDSQIHVLATGSSIVSTGRQVHRVSRFRTYFYLIYYGLDYFFGHRIVAKARHSGRLIYLDRYVYDYVIQPGFINIENAAFRLLLSLIPKPDLIFYLYAPASVVHRRKPELSIQEIERQGEVCTQLSERLSNYHVIDNTQPLAETTRSILAKTLEYFAQQNKSYFQFRNFRKT